MYLLSDKFSPNLLNFVKNKSKILFTFSVFIITILANVTPPPQKKERNLKA